MVVTGHTLQIFCIFGVLFSLFTESLLENVIRNVDPCEDVCQKTYPLHTYDKSLPVACCRRGCRLYSILELLRHVNGINDTIKICSDNCKEAYPKKEDETSACILGCSSQKPFIPTLENFDKESNLAVGDMQHMMYPVLYMHNLYSNVMDKVMLQVSVSWSFIMQDSSGRIIIIKSQPQVQHNTEDVQHLSDFSVGTGTIMKTSIDASGNPATEVLRHSQLKSSKSVGNDINAAQASSWTYYQNDDYNSDLLSCIARKTGVPRLLLSMLFLLSTIALVCLCITTTATAPEQRTIQRLSIRSDLDYLHTLPNKKGIQEILAQDVIQARPLPVKLTIDHI